MRGRRGEKMKRRRVEELKDCDVVMWCEVMR
jgi:hypothetical protein